MDKLQSLADYLGVIDPTLKDAPAPPEPDLTSLTPAKFCQAVLSSVQYRESLLRRIIMDKLPPAVELWYLNTAYGKPVERMEVKDTTDPLDDLTQESIDQRIARLQEISRQLRTNDEVHQLSDDDDGSTPSAVH